MKTYAVGATAYHKNGLHAEVYSVLPNNEYLMWLNPGEERPQYDVWHVNDMVDTAEEIVSPVLKEYQEAQALLTQTEEKLFRAQRDLERANQAVNASKQDRLAQFFGNEDLIHRITGVLGMKITHFYFPQANGEGQGVIIPFEETIERRPGGFVSHGRMLSLKIGGKRSSNDMHWTLNTYSDGSGRDSWCIPCFSLEEAKEFQQKELDEYLAKTSLATGSELTSIKLFADRQELQIPCKIAEAYWEQRRHDLTGSINASQKQIDKNMVDLSAAEVQLAKLKGNAAATTEEV